MDVHLSSLHSIEQKSIAITNDDSGSLQKNRIKNFHHALGIEMYASNSQRNTLHERV